LTMDIDRDKANAELARLCDLVRKGEFKGKPFYHPTDASWRETPPDFLSGLLPDGSCDEAQVNGELLGRLVLRLKARAWLWWDGSDWVGEATDGEEQATHAHPVVALYLAAKDAGLLEKGEGRE